MRLDLTPLSRSERMTPSYGIAQFAVENPWLIVKTLWDKNREFWGTQRTNWVAHPRSKVVDPRRVVVGFNVYTKVFLCQLGKNVTEIKSIIAWFFSFHFVVQDRAQAILALFILLDFLIFSFLFCAVRKRKEKKRKGRDEFWSMQDHSIRDCGTLLLTNESTNIVSIVAAFLPNGALLTVRRTSEPYFNCSNVQCQIGLLWFRFMV